MLLFQKYHSLKAQMMVMGFLDSSAGNESAYNAGDPGLIPGLGRCSGEGIRLPTPVFLGFSGGSDGKESTCNAGNLGSIPGLGRFPWGREWHLLQYPCLENPTDRGAWRATVPGITKSRTRLSD